MIKSLLLLMMLTIATMSQAQSVIFHENFDLPSNGDSVTASGASNNFATNSRLHVTGSQCDSAVVTQNDTAYLTTNSFSTLGMTSVFLSFSHICKIEQQDIGEVQVSINNGITWTKLTSTEYINPGNSHFSSNGNVFNSNTYPYEWLPAYCLLKPNQNWWKNEIFNIGGLVGNQPNVKVRFALRDGDNNGSYYNHGWYIDNIKISNSGLANNQCQAFFTYNYAPGNDSLKLFDNSFNMDSSQINITSRTWTATYGGLNHTFTNQNPVIPLNGYNGQILICLSIITAGMIPCQSSFYDTIYASNPLLCHAEFNLQYNSFLQTLNLTDSSYNTNLSTINITHRNWNIQLFNDTNIFTPILTITDTTPNPSIQIPSNFIGKARVFYQIVTANSCSDSDMDSLYINITPNVFCQAAFTFNYDTSTNILYLLDTSYNGNGLPINVYTWGWTAEFGGAIHQYNTQNPVIQLNGTTNSVPVCLTINSANFCQSTFCTVITLINVPPDTCISSFSFLIDSTVNPPIMYCTDNSYTNWGTINSWLWILNRNGSQLATSQLQNPIFTLQPTGVYSITLTIGSTNGCSVSHPEYFSTGFPPNCYFAVSAFINHVSVINGADGFIDLTVSGGSPPYSYFWNNGDTTQDISNLTSGLYTVGISTAPVCPIYTFSYTILEPYDSLNIVVDTLYSGIIDTCINFTVDSFYVSNINVQGNTVAVEWVLLGGVDTVILDITYNYSSFGAQVVVLTVNCDGAKDLTTYISYIYVSQIYNVPEHAKDENINLYPNPVSDMLNITFGELCKNPIAVKIFSDIGQQVLFAKFEANTEQLQINTRNFPSGFYFIQVDRGDGKPIVKKFIK